MYYKRKMSELNMENQNPQIKNWIFSFIFAFILPVIAYGILKGFRVSDTVSLGVATAFPVLLTLGTGIKKRKINPIGLVAICGFLISIVAVYLTHGNDLAFKLWHPILTGTIGIVFLFSSAINRPIMGVLLKNKHVISVSTDRNEREDLPDEKREMDRFLMSFTLFMGAIFALHALATIMLAFLVGTTSFVLLSKGIDILAILLLILGIYFINKKFSEDESDTKA